MRDAGLEDVRGEAVMELGNSALQHAMRLTIERFAAQLEASGAVPRDAITACLAVVDDPSLVFTGSPMFSIWGRRTA